MTPEEAGLRDAMSALYKQPCCCVSCSVCGGTGNIRVRYDALGRMSEGYGDDLDDLEPCDQCHGGVTEECERCIELNELDGQLEELREREERRK
jgi:hypothetical protein